MLDEGLKDCFTVNCSTKPEWITKIIELVKFYYDINWTLKQYANNDQQQQNPKEPLCPYKLNSFMEVENVFSAANATELDEIIKTKITNGKTASDLANDLEFNLDVNAVNDFLEKIAKSGKKYTIDSNVERDATTLVKNLFNQSFQLYEECKEECQLYESDRRNLLNYLISTRHAIGLTARSDPNGNSFKSEQQNVVEFSTLIRNSSASMESHLIEVRKYIAELKKLQPKLADFLKEIKKAKSTKRFGII